MSATKPTTNNRVEPSPGDPSPKDEWEDWEEDEEVPLVMDDKDGLLINFSNETIQQQPSKPATTQSITRNTARYSVQKPVRIKSRGRQKAQNAKAGIRLVTDMSKFRRQTPATQQTRSIIQAHENPKGKYVDAAALHALEGEPSSASIGSFSWLKRKPGNIRSSKPSNKPVRASSSDLSPDSRPIVIGISLPSDNLSEHQVSPHTAVIETPVDFSTPSQHSTMGTGNPKPTALVPQQLRSVWSPDTEASESPYLSSRATSSIYSQPSIYGGFARDTDVPPVPALPAALKPKHKQLAGLDDADDDDVGTPCTLFEEDGSPVATRKSSKPKASMMSPESASSRAQGWWDHVTTPFLQQSNPFKQQAQEADSNSPQQWNPFKKQAQGTECSTSPPPSAAHREWWDGVDEKGEPSPKISGLAITTPAALQPPPQQQLMAESAGPSSRQIPSDHVETQSEKARILAEENQKQSEEPPPYSPPQSVNVVKYAAVLPPSHIVNTQQVPSPGPMTPGLPGTMTSQGAINMAEIPLTPPAVRSVPAAVLPDRAPGSYVTGDHFYEARGQANRTERRRRRHEKEDAVARKAGGFWRGRGCVPANGCFGRTGREGRKRRRVWLGVIGGIIAAIILSVVLAVVLTRQRPEDSPVPSIWLNLTDFPPMPTGVLTVAGPENPEGRSGCLVATASTAWSCSLPKEEHESVSPHAPNQPTFVFQIQYDNNTRALWNISNEDKESNITDTGFTPDPEPPSIAEMRFLGNTTDHIEEDDKAGEPTPFFISLLTSVNDTIGPNMLSRRQGPNNAIGSAEDNGTASSDLSDRLPPPASNGDGTGAPARLFPLASQQPVRLFDRGLPTEHYGFYTYFEKTIYVKNTVNVDSADEDGGSFLTEAKSIVTFAQTRFLVQMWTRLENSTRLLGDGAIQGTNDTSVLSTPGSMPYPVTITEDMHGGDVSKKINFRYGVLDNQEINTKDAQLILVETGFAGTLVNGRNDDPDLSLGGVDGGTGGCNCVWINFKGLTKISTK
ncbi:hypothetical protein AAE478_000177 [Parahypoxylon ruwenzoriense]